MPLPTRRAFDVAVIGLGAVGSALVRELAQRGVSVVGVDRFHPPHDRGSSHGLTRITRLAVGEGDAFVPIVKRSHAIWRDLEAATGETLHRRTGGLLVVSDGADAYAYHGTQGFFSRTVAIANAHAIPHERLDAAAIRERFPMFTPGDDAEGYLEHEAGVLFPEKIVAANLAVAARHGAVLRYGERVASVGASNDGSADIVTDRGRISAARAVVTAGPWMPGLVGASPLGRPVRVLRQVLFWYRATEPELFAPSRCPVWIWIHGPGASGSAYGFPMVDGVDGAKAASEQDTVESDPDRVDRNVSAAEVQAMFDSHLAGRVRGLSREAVRTATCLYSNTSDAAFIVRDHAESPAVTIVSACSGHGFKHSAALGEALAERVLGLPTTVPLDAFAPVAGMG